MSDVTIAKDPEYGIVEATAIIDNGDFGTRTIRLETGQLARQADGSVTAYLDEGTMLLATTTASSQPREGFDFFPLTVDVEERMYAAGRIPGSFFRREGRPSTEAILACRLIDRPLRPTFVKGLRNEVQVIVTVMSTTIYRCINARIPSTPHQRNRCATDRACDSQHIHYGGRNNEHEPLVSQHATKMTQPI